MLIRFTIENYLSFGKKTEFTPYATREMHHRARTATGPLPGLRILPIAAIYGANASGKTNLFKALQAVQWLVVNGTRAGEFLPVQTFRLDRTRQGQPSRFGVEFLAGGKAYAYEFGATSSAVVEESLKEIRVASEPLVFSRKAGAAGPVFEFGPAAGAENETEEQFLEFVGKGTRSNQLFLHEALDRDVKQLKPVVEWFRTKLLLIDPRAEHLTLGLQMHTQEQFRQFCTSAIKNIGAGIESLSTEVVPLDEAVFSEGLREQLRAQVTGENAVLLRTPNGQRYYVARIDGAIQVAKVVTFRTGSDGKPVRFEIPEESDGTQRFIDLLPALHELGADGSEKVVFVDELDRSFHSGLTRTIIESFFFEWEPTSRAQLLFTTHDATLIDQELFRRDELWLVEKNDAGETELKALSDYRVRSDKRLMKDYLLGRYGAIPPGRMVRMRPLPKARTEHEAAVK
jgi:AAA15 family ATPase/GTPase